MFIMKTERKSHRIRFQQSFLVPQQNNMIELTIEHEHQHDHQHKEEEEGHHHQHSSDGAQEEEDLDHVPCHPHRPVEKFDFTAIEEKIRIIRRKKEEAKAMALMARRIQKSRDQIYESDVIDEALEESLDLVPSHISISIKHRLKFIEDKVYIGAQNDSFSSLVSRIKQEVLSNQALGNQLNLMMTEVQCDIENDIEEGNYQIHKVARKQKNIPIQQEPAHRVKLKNMLIKNKLVDFREEMNKSQIGSESLIAASHDDSSSRIYGQRQDGQIWGDEFHILSEGTKKATQFVKNIRKEQELMRRQRSRKAQELQSLQVKSAMEHKQFEEQMKKERHETLKKRYLEGREEKKIEKEKKEEKQKQFLKFIKEYRGKKPLFRIKEEQYLHNVVEEENRRRKAIMDEIHQTKKAMSREDFLEHEENYKKLKDQKMAQQAAEREMKRKQEENLPRKSFYRGKFHSLIKVEEEEKKKVVDPTLARDELLKKQKQFGQFVRQKYAPHISEAKKKQLDEMMLDLEKKSRKGLSIQQQKKLGNQYLKQMHKMIQELRSKGLIKSTIIHEQNPKKIDYLRQVRDRYNFSTVDYSTQVEANEQWVKNKAIKSEIDAKNKEKVLKFTNERDFDIQKYMRELQQINNNYINSAEAKISLINKLEGKSPVRSARRSLVSSKNESEFDY